MGVFIIPKNICKEINDAMDSFWWEDNDVAWCRIFVPMNMGGMVFRDLHSYNLAIF
jgi:hypothetical protein